MLGIVSGRHLDHHGDLADRRIVLAHMDRFHHRRAFGIARGEVLVAFGGQFVGLDVDPVLAMGVRDHRLFGELDPRLVVFEGHPLFIVAEV
jgi:hypothetical protein